MQKIILFGASNGGIRVLYLLNNEYEVIAFADNDIEKQGKNLLGRPIISPRQINEYQFDLIIITNIHVNEINNQLVNQLGIKEDKIIDYYKNNIYDTRIATLRMVADEIKEQEISGNIAELGVFQGEFAKYINAAFPQRKIYLFDTFEGFNEKDIKLEQNQRYSKSTIGEYCNPHIDLVLEKMIHKDNCLIKKGYFPESLEGLEDIFAFVSIDVDLYQPTYEGLKYFYPRMAEGGYIFIHDFNNIRYPGVKAAVRKFNKENKISYTPISDLGGSIIISK